MVVQAWGYGALDFDYHNYLWGSSGRDNGILPCGSSAAEKGSVYPSPRGRYFRGYPGTAQVVRALMQPLGSRLGHGDWLYRTLRRGERCYLRKSWPASRSFWILHSLCRWLGRAIPRTGWLICCRAVRGLRCPACFTNNCSRVKSR